MIDLLRHCESIFNAFGHDLKDCSLSQLGKEQAGHIKGKYDLVILSPLKRTRQTLELSNITYNKLQINELAREHKIDMCDFLEEENFIIETEEELYIRIEKLKKYLNLVQKNNPKDKILLISHYDIIWHMTSTRSAAIFDCSKIEFGEKFGIGLKNGEISTYTFSQYD